MSENDQLPLQGIRILDFTRVLAGPLCTMLLGDLGADVIKVENPSNGDETRTWGPPWVGNQSAYFICLNRNKRSLTLDLKSEQGRQIAQTLARESHIIIENFKPGQMTRFGLGYETLRKQNAALVYCSITGFGQTGPYHDRPGYDFVIQAMSGLMSITGTVDGEAYKVGVAVSDVFTALYACNAIQAALRHAEHTGIGQHIDMALFDSQLAALVNIASNYLVGGTTPARYGNAHANIVPYQTFEASDGAFAVAVGNDGQFRRLCTLLERPALSDDPRFATNPARVANRDTLIEILQAIFTTAPVDVWVERLLAAGIPAGPINTIAQALEDPHTVERGMVEEMQIDDATAVKMLKSPLNLSETPPVNRLPPPRHGEHTREILRDVVGLPEGTIRQMQADGIV